VAHFANVLINPKLGLFGPAVIVANRCAGTGATQIYSASGAQVTGGFSGLAISAHGRYVAFNDVSSNTVIRLDRDIDGNGALDDSGLDAVATPFPALGPSLGDENLTNKVAIAAVVGRTLAHVYLWDPTKAVGDPAALTLVSANDGTTTPLAGGFGFMPSMTPDGRYVAFVFSPPNTVGVAVALPTDQVLVRDVLTSRTAVVSRNGAGAAGNGRSVTPSISADGTQIAFGTTATDLLAPGVGGAYIPESNIVSLDLLVARSTSGFYATVAFDRASLTPGGDAIDPSPPSDPNSTMDMGQPVLSSNGRWVAFSSRFNAELQTGGSSTTPPIDTDRKVYVIGRPTALTVSPIDFGTIQVGATSAPALATVTNTGISSVLPASIVAGGEFAVVAGGTCAVNAWLPPGASCTVALTFKPAAAGPRPGTLTVSEGGFAAVSKSGPLSGVGQAVVVVTTTTTTTTSTTVPKTGSGTTTTTTTTVPKIAELSVDPDPGNFGSVIVGTVSPEVDFVVTSSGTRSVPITGVTLEGANPGDFVVTFCRISATFNPSTVGPKTAVLTVVTPLGTATSNLNGVGVAQPTLRLLPNVVAVGEVTIAVGAGFPAGQPVQVHWVPDPVHLSGEIVPFTGTADALGNVSIQVPIRPDETTGPRVLTAVDQPGLYSGVTAPGLVVDTSMQPPTGQNPALPNFPALIVRG
jgi:hypothetical protein